MIIQLKSGTSKQLAEELAAKTNAISFTEGDKWILVTSSAVKKLPEVINGYAETQWVMDSDMQLASTHYSAAKREVTWAKTAVGGNTNNTVVIAGPCSVENWDQIEASAKLMVGLGITTLRAGCFKPRTSPYSFQGLGLEGLKMLAEIRKKYGLSIITEAKDSSHIDAVIEHTDIVQIGAKAMYDQSILRACAQIRKPVLLKRGFGSTLQELIQAAETILSGGNNQVMLCERGIRTFETKTRFTFDLTGAAYLKYYTNLPVILDPSHAMGYAYGVPDLTKAAVAFGCDGLLLEVHPNPKIALSDASQQLDHDTFTKLYNGLSGIAKAVNRQIV